MRRFPIIDAPRQSFGVVLNRRRCTMALAYNPGISRWTFDLSIDGELRLAGRRIVVGTDLLAPFSFGLGAIFAGDYAGQGGTPDYDALVSGRVRLYHVTPDEIVAALEVA